MKRSEMIDKIEQYFDNVLPDNWDAKLFTHSYAAEIVELIEDAGMLPPAYIPKGESIWDSLMEWEPETYFRAMTEKEVKSEFPFNPDGKCDSCGAIGTYRNSEFCLCMSCSLTTCITEEEITSENSLL